MESYGVILSVILLIALLRWFYKNT